MVVRILLTGVLLTGCAVFDNPPLKGELDLSPVGCRYKWFQSGYSPDLAKSCDAPREHQREEQTLLAQINAWDIAGQRCPARRVNCKILSHGATRRLTAFAAQVSCISTHGCFFSVAADRCRNCSGQAQSKIAPLSDCSVFLQVRASRDEQFLED